jgi:hypothetical protein
MSRPQVLDDAAIADLAERHLLNYFWVARPDDPLGLLLAFTRIVVKRPPSWDVEAIRAAHGVNRGQPATIRATHDRCGACGASGQLYAHHIIEIQNGGSNSIRNQFPLCFDCHQYLHPWLTDDDRVGGKRTTSFESLGEIAGRTMRAKVDES